MIPLHVRAEAHSSMTELQKLDERWTAMVSGSYKSAMGDLSSQQAQAAVKSAGENAKRLDDMLTMAEGVLATNAAKKASSSAQSRLPPAKKKNTKIDHVRYTERCIPCARSDRFHRRLYCMGVQYSLMVTVARAAECSAPDPSKKTKHKKAKPKHKQARENMRGEEGREEKRRAGKQT